MNLATQLAITTATNSASQVAAAERAADRARLAGIVRAYKNGLALTEDDISFLVNYHDPGEPMTTREKLVVVFVVTLLVTGILVFLGWVGVFGHGVENLLHGLAGEQCVSRNWVTDTCLTWR